MSKVLFKKSKLSGSIIVPSSKSQTIRALLFASLAKGKSEILYPLFSPDTFAMIEGCKQLGAQIQTYYKKIVIEGVNGKPIDQPRFIDAQNSGLVLRFLPTICALSNAPFIITGDHSIQTQRVLHPLLDGLVQLGAACYSLKKQGYAPAFIKGPITSGTIYIDGQDSQPVSSFLIASCFLKGETKILVKNPGEIPWVGLTLHWLDKFKISYERQSSTHYVIKGNNTISPFSYQVPGDFSSAFYPIAAALITNSCIEVCNLDFEDRQGDKIFIDIVKKMGADIAIFPEQRKLIVKKSGPLKGMKINVNDCIDSVTIFAVLGCYAEGKTEISGANIAKTKECDRLSCITQELKKMGAKIEETSDGLLIEQCQLKGACLSSYQDHRMVLSLSCAALGAEGETQIEETNCISKTYSHFFEDLKNLGAHIQ